MSHRKQLPAIAVIADAHVHDMHSHYDFDGITINRQQLTLRSWADTRRSSRVFNESKAALQLALNDIEKRGIKHVVLLGDYSDDGQIESIDRLVHTLCQQRDRCGTNFYAITGNHDAYGPSGKHQSTRYVSSASKTVLVTSDPKVAATEPDSCVLTSRMRCGGVSQGIEKMAEFGLFNQACYIHWESPFGQSDELQHRHYSTKSADGLNEHALVDASYLVEPVEGLWLLMIDANVFEPRNGNWKATQKKAFLDSSDAGWNSLLRNRPYLIDWIYEVCRRADRFNKTLIAFSHYPIIDTFADSANYMHLLFNQSEMLKRSPDKQVSEVLAGAGLQLHFSGHLHINALSERKVHSSYIQDCATPSLAAFPACYKIVDTQLDSTTNKYNIDTIHLGSMALDQSLMEYYRLEQTQHSDADNSVLAASNYGEFLYHRMQTRVIHHYLTKEWPEAIARWVSNSTALELAILMHSEISEIDNNHPLPLTDADTQADALNSIKETASEYSLSLENLADCSMTRLVSDWYCLQHAGCLARAYIEPDNNRVYEYLSDHFGDTNLNIASTPRMFFAAFLGLFKLSIERSTLSTVSNEILSSDEF